MQFPLKRQSPLMPDGAHHDVRFHGGGAAGQALRRGTGRVRGGEAREHVHRNPNLTF